MVFSILNQLTVIILFLEQLRICDLGWSLILIAESALLSLSMYMACGCSFLAFVPVMGAYTQDQLKGRFFRLVSFLSVSFKIDSAFLLLTIEDHYQEDHRSLYHFQTEGSFSFGDSLFNKCTIYGVHCYFIYKMYGLTFVMRFVGNVIFLSLENWIFLTDFFPDQLIL